MADNPVLLLNDSMEELSGDELKMFQWYLLQSGLGFIPMKRGQLEGASTRFETASKVWDTYTVDAVNITINILKKMNKNSVADRLWKHAAPASVPAPPPPQFNPPDDLLGFLKRNRSELVSSVKVVDPVLDDLTGTYHDEVLDLVKRQPTTRAKMRELLDNTSSPTLAKELVNALRKHQPDILYSLS